MVLKNEWVRIVITAAAFLFLGSVGYASYFALSPAVVVNNNSSSRAEFVVYLPSSRLDFGVIEAGNINTIYYSANKGAGHYSYQISVDSLIIEGACGKLANNEYGKRVSITLTKLQQVQCTVTDMFNVR